jgi:hypothetical protein
MLGSIGAAIGAIADLLSLGDAGRKLIGFIQGKREVLWVNAPQPPEKLPKIKGRLIHPDHIDPNLRNKVFLVRTNAASRDKVRYVVRENRTRNESCFVYDLRTGQLVKEFHHQEGSIAWNNFFEKVGHPIPFDATIRYTDDDGWVQHGLRHLALIKAKLED